MASDLISNLYGNPHSACDPTKLSGHMVDETRIKTLQFFGADPEHFDLVFAAIKLVMESFKDLGHASRADRQKDAGFRYFYHADAHNSVVGVRETADDDHRCFRNDEEVEEWLSGRAGYNSSAKLGLFAYPGQSNMTGRRLPLNWSGQLRHSSASQHQDTYSLLDAAALATSSSLKPVFQDLDQAPDFTVLSFYKVFGYPDLGGLIVRKISGRILQWGRKYFGGGTVEGVTVLGSKPWFQSRHTLHESLEDGTLPFHSIIALSAAIDTHRRLYGPDCMNAISKHCTFLGRRLFEQLSSLMHPNGRPLIRIYNGKESTYGDAKTQGATVAFNVQKSDGRFVPYTSVVETLANERKIYLRAGQLCNPGGIALHLGFEGWHVKKLWSSGHRCGAAHFTGTEIFQGKPTGVVRVSLGAMTTMGNVDTLIRFLREEFMTPVQNSMTSRRITQLLPAPAPLHAQMLIRGRDEQFPVERQFAPLNNGMALRSQENILSPSPHPLAFSMNTSTFPPTPSMSGESHQPSRSGTPSYSVRSSERIGSFSVREKISR